MSVPRQWLPRIGMMALSVACHHTRGVVDIATADVVIAIDQQDFDRLVALRSGSGPVAELSAAVVQAMLGQHDSASTALEAIAQTGVHPELAARATLALSGVRVNQGRYLEAAQLMTQVERMDNAHGVTMSPQTRDFFLALGTLPPMRSDVSGTVSVAVVRDKMNLPRVQFTVHGAMDNGVFDTGAAYSTTTATTAARLGLRFLGAQAGVTGSTGTVVRSGLAVADTLHIGTAKFLNVPFIVVPDDALTFREADYTISSIIGFPLIAGMGRVELAKRDTLETLRFSPSSATPDAITANLYLSGWQPVALIGIAEGSGRFRFFLDTGARTSSFFPAVLPRVSFGPLRRGTVRASGAGGVFTQQETEVVPRATLRFGSAEASMDEINVIPADGSNRHGILAQDVLRRFSVVVFDFGAMTMEVH